MHIFKFSHVDNGEIIHKPLWTYKPRKTGRSESFPHKFPLLLLLLHFNLSVYKIRKFFSGRSTTYEVYL